MLYDSYRLKSRTLSAKKLKHDDVIKTFSALLNFCAGKSPVTGDFPAQRVDQFYIWSNSLLRWHRLFGHQSSVITFLFQSAVLFGSNAMIEISFNIAERRVARQQMIFSKANNNENNKVAHYWLFIRRMSFSSKRASKAEIVCMSWRHPDSNFLYRKHLMARESQVKRNETFNKNRSISENDLQLWCLSEAYMRYRIHDDVINWKHFPRYWPFMRGMHRSPVDSPNKGQWRGALILYLIFAWTNGWANNREPGNLRRHRAHYNVTVMLRVIGSSDVFSPTWGPFYWHEFT